MAAQIKVRKIGQDDKPLIQKYWAEYWGGDFIVTRGKIHRLDDATGCIAEIGEQTQGFITYARFLSDLEITSLLSFKENQGIGTALVSSILDFAKVEGLERVWLITTNDNLNALKFWQKRGFKLSGLYPNALAQTRMLKPAIPVVGDNGIPLRDEIELELKLK